MIGVELRPDADWDIVPHALIDRDVVRAERRAVMEQLRNGFWFAHERLQSKAQVHYGSIYALPSELGHFDCAVLGSVLLHTHDPLRVIEECAALSDQLVITERYRRDLDGESGLPSVPDTRVSAVGHLVGVQPGVFRSVSRSHGIYES
jgi:hypothetical protein